MNILPTRAQWLATIAVSGAGTGVVLFVPEASPAYLAAFVLVSALPLGAAAILMVFHCTGGRWGAAIRPCLESAAASTPLLAPLFLPIAISATRLYPWVFANNPGALRHPYDNPGFAALRAAVILGTWVVGGPWIAMRSRAVPPGERGGPGLRAASAAGLIVYVLTATFGFTDWVASLEPHWHSSIFGVIIVCSHGLTALGVVTGLAALAPGRGRPDPAALQDLGSLILAFALLHAYVAFSQFFIIWNGNVPERTVWYVAREKGLWFATILAITIVQFAIPFCAMLFRGLKSSQRAMAGVAGSLLVGAFLEAEWLTLPSSRLDGLVARMLALPIALALLLVVARTSRPPDTFAEADTPGA